ncbi:MAG TPA: hypothetical protein VGG49_13110 [Steroidobacteraceae bacterium]|jgi:hypothetical protein
MEKIDNAVRNGIDQAQQQPEQSPLQTAMARHGKALLELNTDPNTGMIGVDPRQLMIDMELLTVRMEVLFLALIKEHLVDGNKMTVLLTNKLNDEATQMEAAKAAQAPQIQVVPGSILERP